MVELVALADNGILARCYNGFKINRGIPPSGVSWPTVTSGDTATLGGGSTPALRCPAFHVVLRKKTGVLFSVPHRACQICQIGLQAFC